MIYQCTLDQHYRFRALTGSVQGDVASSVVIVATAAAGSGWGLNYGEEVETREGDQRSVGGSRLSVIHAASSTVNPIFHMEAFTVGLRGKYAQGLWFASLILTTLPNLCSKLMASSL